MWCSATISFKLSNRLYLMNKNIWKLCMWTADKHEWNCDPRSVWSSQCAPVWQDHGFVSRSSLNFSGCFFYCLSWKHTARITISLRLYLLYSYRFPAIFTVIPSDMEMAVSKIESCVKNGINRRMLINDTIQTSSNTRQISKYLWTARSRRVKATAVLRTVIITVIR